MVIIFFIIIPLSLSMINFRMYTHSPSIGKLQQSEMYNILYWWDLSIMDTPKLKLTDSL